MDGDRYLEREGARLRWRIEGSGPALVLLHGWALDLDSWDAVVPRLATDFAVLRFDRRGFGLSTGLPDIHRNVEDLCAVMDAAGTSSAAVLGMSQGARFAIHFALQCAPRTRAVLLDGAPLLEAESELPLEEYRQVLQAQGADELRARVLAHPLMQLHTSDAAARATLWQSVGHYQGLDLLHPSTRGESPELRDIGCPVLILNGGLDSDTRREAGAQLQSAVRGATRVEIADAGHLAMLDRAETYAKAVAGFLGVAT